MIHRITGKDKRRSYLERKHRQGGPHIWTRIARPDLDHLDNKKEECICDKCINDYISLYDRIVCMEDVLFEQWKPKLNRAERDKINDIIHKRIKLKKKRK